MEEFGPLVWLAIIWFFASFLSAQKKKKQRAEQARRRAQRSSQATIPAPPKQTSTGVDRTTARAPTAIPSQSRVDPSQREGSALERMLQQLGAELGQLEGDQRGPMGREARVELPSAEEVEEREVLDAPIRRPERVPVVRESRVLVDHDDEAAALVQRRVTAAEQRNRPLTLADHRAFDARIRQAPAKVTSRVRVASRFSAAQIRQAIVWREILGPPLALRDRTPERQ